PSTSTQITRPNEQLRVEQGRAGGAAYRVVRDAGESNAAACGRSKPSNRRRHAAARVAVEARLRPVDGVQDDERRFGGRGKIEGALPRPGLPCAANLLERRGAPRPHERAHEVPVDDRPAVDHRLDREGGLLDGAALGGETPE